MHLEGGPVAIETKLGWTIVGETDRGRNFEETLGESVMYMSVTDYSITQLWDLDTIGVRDNVEVKSQQQQEMEAKDRFLQKISRDPSGRYIVELPWREGHPPLSNKEVAVKRLQATTKKLKEKGLFEVYGKLFEDWEAEDFIEEVGERSSGNVEHYIPHRAVIKPGSLTTPIRPVFDASCGSKMSPFK